MGLSAYRDAPSFAEALAASSGAVYSICNRDRFDPAEVLRLERAAAQKQHRDLLSLYELQAESLAQVEDYFREAARLDPDWRYAYSSKVVLSIPGYQDLQKIFLLRNHFASHSSADVLLLVPDKHLRQLFDELFSGAPPARPLAFPAARAWARFGRTLLRALINRGKHAPASVLLFTLSAGTPRSGADAYFGSLDEHLRERAPTFTVYLASGPALRLLRGTHSLPFETFIFAVDVLTTWIAAFFSGVRVSPPQMTRLESATLAPLHRYMRRTEIRSGEYFMQRLLKRGFQRMLRRMPCEFLVYPFENRTWEKNLMAEAKALGVRRRIGYQHSSITPRHLAFHIGEGELRDQYLPDKVVTIGEFTADVLRKFAPPLSDRVTTGVSLRTARQTVTEAKDAAVLVAISSSRNEALSLLQVTHAAASRTSVPFIVRTHPTIPVDSLFRLFEWPRNVELSTGRTLAEDLSRVTIVAYSSSTVALEGMLYGRLPVFVSIGDLPSGDPIMGEYPFKFLARDGASLAAEVDRMHKLDSGELRRLQDEARGFAERYLRAPTPEAISRMTDVMLSV